MPDIPREKKTHLLLVTSHWIRRIHMYVHLYKKVTFFLQCLIICLFTCVLLSVFVGFFEFYDTSLKRNWDVSTERLIWFQGAHSWWVSEPEIKLFLGPAQGSRVEGKPAWGTHLSLQLQTPFLFIYIPLPISLSCKKATQITYFYKACFPETPVSYCPSSCHLCQNNYCKKRDRRSPTVYSEGRSSLFWKLCGGYFLLFFLGRL